MKKYGVLAVLLTVLLVLVGCGTKDSVEMKLDKDNPVAITVWHYYNSAQKVAFDQLVDEFNQTVGAEQGIIVEAINHGDVTQLTNSVLESADKKVGSKPIPNIFAAYADTAYQVDKKELVVDLEQYLTEDEIAEYIPSYIEEGRLGKAGELKIFPTAKSTEIMILNQTDWKLFAEETGASTEQLSTLEGLVQVAEQYYKWTDGKTPEADDGKAFFGRDAMANYFIIGAKQLGTEIFEVDDKGIVSFHLDETVMKKLWDCYYVPFINGYFASNGKFRADDAKVGDIIALVGSTASSTYFPKSVIVNDQGSYPIDYMVLPAPKFQDGESFAVQQGAGMVVTKATKEQEYASTVFLKWFTEADRNLRFSAMSCYLPVKKEANDLERLNKVIAEGEDQSSSGVTAETMDVAIEIVKTDSLYANRAFEGGTAARAVLENSMQQKAAADKQAVQLLVDGGMSRQQAAAQYNTQENFEAWLNDFREKLNETQKGL